MYNSKLYGGGHSITPRSAAPSPLWGVCGDVGNGRRQWNNDLVLLVISDTMPIWAGAELIFQYR